MSALYSDTDPKMEALQIRLLRESPAWRKMEMLVQLNASARLLALSGLRQRYPGASESELIASAVRWRAPCYRRRYPPRKTGMVPHGWRGLRATGCK
jgi:hypothetical protein